MRWRYTIKTELALALLPTISILLVLVFVDTFSRQRLLFSSLASSAFLIYLDPAHKMNQVKTLSVAQISAAIIGYVVYLLVGAGYLSATISMVLAIAVMIFFRVMHPPAVSTALSFAFREGDTSVLVLFVLSILLLVLLIVLQKLSLWIVRKKTKPTIEDAIK